MSVNPHADRVVSAVVSAKPPPHREGGNIIASWRRCIEDYGLEPHRMRIPSVVSTRELQDICEPLDDFISLARGEIERLFARLAENDYVVTLNDSEGVSVLVYCADSQTARAREARLLVGAVWAEESQGTNGIGTCIKQRDAVSVVGGDHFNSYLTQLSCTVAPIFGPAGRLISALNVTTARATNHETQTIVRGVVKRSARRIENLYFGRRHSGLRIVRLSREEDFADISGEVRLALDAADRIVDTSPGVASFLKTPLRDLVGRNLGEVMELTGRKLAASGRQVQRASSQQGDVVFISTSEPVPLARQARGIDRQASVGFSANDLVGRDPRMAEQLRIAQRLVDRRLPILIQGETGTGKSLLARALHRASRHAAGPFVAINCGAIPPELIESELFGYRAGAFTGAAKGGAKGRLLEADGGTLFLDEIGDMPLALQTRLLQVLSDGEFVPVGATAPVRVELAVLSASLHDLADLTRQGRFRADLYFRLNGLTLALPPLRRRSDRADWIDLVLAEEARDAGCPGKYLAAEARDLMVAYAWPGNLRELRHCCRYAVTVDDGDEIALRHLPPALSGDGGAGGPGTQQLVELALRQTAWNVSAAAQRLGVSRATLHRRIKALGLRRKGRDS